MSPRERIVAQVRKLWALARRAGTPEKGASARRAAQRLAKKHKVTPQELQQMVDAEHATLDVTPWLTCTWAFMMLCDVAALSGCAMEVVGDGLATLKGPGAARVLKETTIMREEIRVRMLTGEWMLGRLNLGFAYVPVTVLPMSEDAYALLMSQGFAQVVQERLQKVQEDTGAPETSRSAHKQDQGTPAAAQPQPDPNPEPPKQDPAIDPNWQPSQEDHDRVRQHQAFLQRIQQVTQSFHALRMDPGLRAKASGSIDPLFWRHRAHGLWPAPSGGISGLLTMDAAK